MSAVTGRSRLKDFSRMASGKPGPSKDGRHASFNMKSITLTDGYLPIACFQEPSHRQSRTVQVLRPTYSNASPFRSNRPRKNEEVTTGDFDWRLGSIYTACRRRTATDGHVTFCEEEVPFIIDSKKGRRVEGLDPESANRFLKIISAEIVRAFLAVEVNFGGSRTYLISVRVEDPEEARFIKVHTRLNTVQRVFTY